MFAILLLLQATTAAVPVQSDENTIVVTGKRLRDTADALARCIAASCPPDKEIDAAIAHAENQFVAGDYGGARATLRRSRGRNKRYAASYPVPVADLWRSTARVAAHLGIGSEMRMGMIASTDVLEDAFGSDDPRTLAQRIELAEALAQQFRGDAATSLYRSVARRAELAGHPREQAFALFRLMMRGFANGRIVGGGSRQARDDLKGIAGPEARSYRDAARLVTAIEEGDASYERMLAELTAASRASGSRRPVMVYAPPYKGYEAIGRDQIAINRAVIQQMPTRDQWMDVAFWIKPDGSVADVAMLRGSEGLQPIWTKPVIDVVAGRRYMPMPTLPAEGMLRVERYTYMAWNTSLPGTRIGGKDGQPQVQMLDLTTDAVPAS